MTDDMLKRRGFFKNSLMSAAKAAYEFHKGTNPVQSKKIVTYGIDYSLRPPGAVPEKTFLELCTRCDDCVKACPAKCIKKSTAKGMAGTPVIMPREEPCVLCDDLRCIKACTTGALAPVAREQVAMGIAQIDKKKCIAWDGENCQVCSAKCPFPGEAIVLDDFRPVINEEKCTGCGLCEQACLAINNRAPIRVMSSRLWSIIQWRNKI